MVIKFKICNKIYTLEDENIESVVLFGSYARGEADRTSDMDIFVLIKDCSEKDFINQKRNIVKCLDVPPDWISVYRISSVIEMQRHGSYFLWHLKVEGKILFSRTGLLERFLNELPQYTGVEQDLHDYLTICYDVKKSLLQDSTTFLYEMAVMASLIRNTCISLVYLKGEMSFGRVLPVIIAQKIIGKEFPFQIDEYKVLYKYRISYIRGQNVANVLDEKLNINIVKEWAERVEKLVLICLSIINEKEREIHVPKY